jgi:hypothetical protein
MNFSGTSAGLINTCMNMRQIIRLVQPILEAFSDDIWGYWITAEGRIIAVSDHHEYASGFFGEEGDDPDDEKEFSDTILRAIASGWIRVTCPHLSFAADFSPAVSPKARVALNRLILRDGDFAEYRIAGQVFRLTREAARAAISTAGEDL